MDNRLNLSLQCTTASTKAYQILGYIHRAITSRETHDRPTLLNACQATSGILCPMFWSSQLRGKENKLERVKRIATNMIKGLVTLPYEEKLNELDVFSLDKAQRKTHHIIPVLKGCLQRQWRPSLHKEPHGEEQWIPTAPGEVSSWYKKEIFCCNENNHSPEQHPQGCSRVPIIGGFQDATEQGTRQSHLGSLFHDRLDQIIF